MSGTAEDEEGAGAGVHLRAAEGVAEELAEVGLEDVLVDGGVAEFGADDFHGPVEEVVFLRHHLDPTPLPHHPTK